MGVGELVERDLVICNVPVSDSSSAQRREERRTILDVVRLLVAGSVVENQSEAVLREVLVGRARPRLEALLRVDELLALERETGTRRRR